MAKHGEYNPGKSHIRVLRNREFDVNIAVLDMHCDFCDRCIQNCIPKAIRFVTPEEAALLRKKNKLSVFPAPLVKGA